MSRNERKDIVKKIATVVATTLLVAGSVAPANAETTTPLSWGLDRIDQSSIQLDKSYTYPESAGTGVRVYVLDTGVQGDLLSFGGRVLEGYDATTGYGGKANTDCHGHGTHVAGTIASSTYGVAPKATIVPVKVTSCTGGVSSTWIYKALEWVLANHPAGTPGVVNMSVAVSYNESINNLADKLYRQGLVVVTAAGNYNNRVNACRLSPSSATAILTVGSINDNGYRTNTSNYGDCVDLYAPGGSIVSEDPKLASRIRTGTSMAAPHVSGAAALYLAMPGSEGSAMFNHLVLRHASEGTIQNLSLGINKVLDISFISSLGSSTPATEEVVPVELDVPTIEEPIQVQTIATAPRSLSVMSGSTRMVLSWIAPHNADQVSIKYYRIEYSYDGGRVWRQVTKAVASSTGIQVSKPPVNYIVSYRIYAVTDAGDSEPSNVTKIRVGR